MKKYFLQEIELITNNKIILNMIFDRKVEWIVDLKFYEKIKI